MTTLFINKRYNEILKKEVDKQAERLVQQYHIHGLVVGLILDGKSHF
ncbi:hypothetical protein [Pseudoalteromonas rhizosphaerae]